MTAGRLPGACGNESAQQLPARDSLVAVEGAREHIEGAWGHVSAASPAIIPKPYTPVRHKAGASDDGVGCGAAGGADRQDGESQIDSRNPSETADLAPAKLISSVGSPSGSAPDTEAEVTAAAAPAAILGVLPAALSRDCSSANSETSNFDRGLSPKEALTPVHSDVLVTAALSDTLHDDDGPVSNLYAASESCATAHADSCGHPTIMPVFAAGLVSEAEAGGVRGCGAQVQSGLNPGMRCGVDERRQEEGGGWGGRVLVGRWQGCGWCCELGRNELVSSPDKYD